MFRVATANAWAKAAPEIFPLGKLMPRPVLAVPHDFRIGAGGRCGKVEHPFYKSLSDDLFKPRLDLPAPQAV